MQPKIGCFVPPPNTSLLWGDCAGERCQLSWLDLFFLSLWSTEGQMDTQTNACPGAEDLCSHPENGEEASGGRKAQSASPENVPLGAKNCGFSSDIFLGATAGLAQSGEELKFCYKELCTFLAPGKRKCLEA